VTDIQCYQPPSLKKNAIRFEDSTEVPVNVFADVLKATRATPIATWDRDYMKGSPRHREQVCKGTAVYYASFFNLERPPPDARYTAEYGLKPLLTASPATSK